MGAYALFEYIYILFYLILPTRLEGVDAVVAMDVFWGHTGADARGSLEVVI